MIQTAQNQLHSVDRNRVILKRSEESNDRGLLTLYILHFHDLSIHQQTYCLWIL